MLDIAVPRLWQPALQQRVYRQLLLGFSYPGTVRCLLSGDDASESYRAIDAVVATMLDGAVSLHQCTRLLCDDTVRFTGCPEATSAGADWIVADGRQKVSDDLDPRVGSLEEPERSATLVLVVTSLASEQRTDHFGIPLRGPGIHDENTLFISGLHESWLNQRKTWCAKFPQGVDIILCDEWHLAVLPRTTILVEKE